jgi:hypothetical protein
MEPSDEATDAHLKDLRTWLSYSRLRVRKNAALKRLAFSLAVAIILISVVYYYYTAKGNTPASAAALLGSIVLSFLSLLVAVNCRANQNRLEAANEEAQFEIDLIQYPVKDWEIRAEKTLIQNDRRLRRYYDQNLAENDKLYYLGTLCILLGIVILCVSLFAIYKSDKRPLDSKIIIAVLGAIGSLLTNYVAAIYLKMHADASRNLGTFHGRLVDTHQVLLANMIASRIDDDSKRWATYANVAENIVKPRYNRADKEDKDEDGSNLEGLAKIVERLTKRENGASKKDDDSENKRPS